MCVCVCVLACICCRGKKIESLINFPAPACVRPTLLREFDASVRVHHPLSIALALVLLFLLLLLVSSNVLESEKRSSKLLGWM